ncbi:hypothetical protein Pan216_29130 [Planctomycetes bacterium Pan216]|uniref:Uncharacterized protein n=2 Tax=Kolteria novifilia TaxID=2527975 RepID=A0A518B500_9BACT|nr:hypothetical protein Pan216_29130 [Planctomycetes bacterium Pan216]
MISAEEVLAKLFELRKEYNDDPEDPMYQALHHACLFISYKIGDFKDYLAEAELQEEDDE